ncbi:MAG: hypothetical protein LBQ05_02850 [Christensenellaceae bacterium]|jgi:hypothetical protein|nr:hypothetical protein [Christensenellaceae bacterium]
MKKLSKFICGIDADKIHDSHTPKVIGAVAGIALTAGLVIGSNNAELNAIQNTDKEFTQKVAQYEEHGVTKEMLVALEEDGLIEKLPECREKQILKLLVRGYTREEIAEKVLTGAIKLSDVSTDITKVPLSGGKIAYNVLCGITGVVGGIIATLLASLAQMGIGNSVENLQYWIIDREEEKQKKLKAKEEENKKQESGTKEPEKTESDTEIEHAR